MFDNVIFYEKYSSKLKEENAFFNGQVYRGLSLTTDGLLFDPNNTFLANRNNKGLHPFSMKKATRNLMIGFKEINRVEIGNYKSLWATIYTLRVYLNNGETHYFTMPKRKQR